MYILKKIKRERTLNPQENLAESLIYYLLFPFDPASGAVERSSRNGTFFHFFILRGIKTRRSKDSIGIRHARATKPREPPRPSTRLTRKSERRKGIRRSTRVAASRLYKRSHIAAIRASIRASGRLVNIIIRSAIDQSLHQLRSDS